MYCSKCGNQIADGSKFCSFCGAPQSTEEVKTEIERGIDSLLAAEEPVVQRKSVLDDIDWNIQDYPGSNTVSKTEDIDFDWGAKPEDIKDRYTTGLTREEAAEVVAKAEEPVIEAIPARPEAPVEPEAVAEPEPARPVEQIDKFYTFSKKNEEFQQLLNREYAKIKSGNPIEEELSVASKAAEQKFEERPEDQSMDAFFKREGVVKPYEPKAFESDVLARIEAQERAREKERKEEEARQKMMEEERAKAEAERKAKEAEEAVRAKIEAEERAKIEAEAAARAKAEAEARAKAEAEAAERARAEEEARARAEAERKAREEAEARKTAEEAARAEEEARIAREEAERAEREAEEAARAKAAEEAARAEEEARIKAEMERRAAAEAAKIKAQREARAKALEEERIRAEQIRRKAEEERIREKLNKEQHDLEVQADTAAAETEARRILEQTARMREEEAAKIRAAVAGLRGETRQPKAPAPVEQTVMPEEPEISVQKVAAQAPSRPEPSYTGRSFESTQTRTDLDEMAKAREAFLAEFGIKPGEPKKEEPKAPVTEPVPRTVEELLGEKPVTDREEMLSAEGARTATRVVDKSSVLSELDKTIRLTKEELMEVTRKSVTPAEDLFKEKLEQLDAVNIEEPVAEQAPVAATAVLEAEEQESEPANVEDLLSRFATTTEEAIAAEEEEPTEEISPEAEEETALETEEEPFEGLVQKEEPAIAPEETRVGEDKPGLHNTMIMPAVDGTEKMDDSFESYGEKEAEELRRQQEEAAEAAKAVPAVSEEKEAVEDEDKASKEKGGAGRIVLKVILVILIVIFAAELAGIAIKFAAPNSKATEFMDNQLNKVIHLITGAEQDYEVPEIDYNV